MQQQYVFGDIHGGLRALNQLLSMLPLKSGDRLIFLGDYADGWPDTAGVISRLMELQQQYDCVFVLGNHDAWCSNWLKDGSTDSLWLASGGAATIESYAKADPNIRPLHLEFFERMVKYYVDEANNLFIHAGFCSMHGPAQDRYETNYYWDRTLLETALSLDPAMQPDNPFYPKRLKHFSRIFIGHTPTTNYGIAEPIKAANLWNMDTGAAFRGRLTALNIAAETYLQSDPLYLLYPEAQGRTK